MTHTLENALDNLSVQQLDSLGYGEEVVLNENFTLYHYIEDDVIVVNESNEWDEIVQILYNVEADDIQIEVLNEELFDKYIKL